ncbi:MAG: DEAD/DEAH box helicase family protein [Chloroflexota bacterium]|nr:DEAD/DEAH box helicase family protein [Chloroflexota bacterium]MDE2961501.1 DEAD/DEAH box helicase family protein [Chloroflexota bacterium]
MIEIAGWSYREEAPARRRNGAGFADYMLFDDAGTAVALLEAKSADKHPLIGKEQAREYGVSLGVSHVILSNGGLHYAWDTRAGDPKRVLALPSPAELINLQSRPPRDRSRLWTTDVKPDYLKTVAESDIEMRRYQVAAINAIQQQAQAGDTAFLLEMATGTGKTTVAAALCFLYLNTGNARRILFLVDRIELRQQAVAGINAALNEQYVVRAYSGDPAYDWERIHVTVTTVQSIDALMRDGQSIPADQFDLIIADEAHRCISGPNHRRLFEQFHAEKIGLTATPRTFVNNAVAEDDDSPAAQEQRALRDTYLAFGLPPGEPTYAYTIAQGVQDGYLVGPTAVDVRTEVTRQLMSDEGYQVTIADYETSGGDLDLAYHAGDFARTFLSPGTNAEFARVYLEEALREPETDLIGKGIIYAVNQRHAAALTQALNEAASARWTGAYNSDFAVQVTSHVYDANIFGEQFKHNSLSGQHPEVPGCATSKTRVCVTVAMMTTGFDCPDLLNIGVCRPIKSPVDFTQIKGRGTRRYDFRNNYTDPRVREQLAPRPKEKFKIIDFFGVCEYHHETDYYEPRISVPTSKPADGDDGTDGSLSESGAPIGKGVFVRYGADQTETAIQLTFETDSRRIADRQPLHNLRAELRQRLEATNQVVADAFSQYLEQYPVAGDRLENVVALFEAYSTDQAARDAIDKGRFAALTGTTLPLAQYIAVPDEHRERIPGYVRAHLLDGEQAA